MGSRKVQIKGKSLSDFKKFLLGTLGIDSFNTFWYSAGSNKNKEQREGELALSSAAVMCIRRELFAHSTWGHW